MAEIQVYNLKQEGECFLFVAKYVLNVLLMLAEIEQPASEIMNPLVQSHIYKQ